jgi:hypothetical protein
MSWGIYLTKMPHVLDVSCYIQYRKFSRQKYVLHGLYRGAKPNKICFSSPSHWLSQQLYIYRLCAYGLCQLIQLIDMSVRWSAGASAIDPGGGGGRLGNIHHSHNTGNKHLIYRSRHLKLGLKNRGFLKRCAGIDAASPSAAPVPTLIHTDL